MGDAGAREWAPLAMLVAIDFDEELGLIWNAEAERRRAAVREAFGTGLSGHFEVISQGRRPAQ